MRQLAADLALLAAGIGFMAGMLILVIPMSLAEAITEAKVAA